ncbi:TIGR03364 family FAD-dependent oxidoreductase [Gluconacetobacter tumulisoli]|uniref:TIGR03364 family FAD-dependent oxidoreductase n=1 Tax=Gluconacetobacter tumulisoli TaxID=1286189 RepID=A0A7W4PLN6_9PROT|nr:TIGR03364 family FAD-dependent oxidoreductase [Gluconacetobacter tumulisoli]MBB2202330.1 TIGR03364 family FAD-dependent oxidoreductase [Gluconacetobacter tumulisoli]
MKHAKQVFDLAVVGAGICGLAHALAAARRGKRVVVIDRDLAASGASIRNFGLITVTGQAAGDCWDHAFRSRQVWAEVMEQTGIASPQTGLLVVARRPEAQAVLESFAGTDMGRACRLMRPADIAAAYDGLHADRFAGALFSPHEIRVESREVIPRLADWLAQAYGVVFMRGVTVFDVVPPILETSQGPIWAEATVICPGDDFRTLAPDRLAAYGLTRCKLQMLRLRPARHDPRLPAIMSDLGMVRYGGYAALPEAGALQGRLMAEQPDHLRHGIHLIAVRSEDGSMVVGDSHRYGPSPDPFGATEIDDLILDEYRAVFDDRPQVTERWTGTYASAEGRWMLRDRPRDDVRIVVITSGTGASTSFSIAIDTIEELWGS